VHAALRWLALGLCAFFALHGVHAGLRPSGSDFTVFYRAGEAVLAGRDPTQVERFLYPPFFALVVAPLAWLPYALALVLWQLASLGALAWITHTSARWCARAVARPCRWLAWLPLVACLRLIDSNLANGQANLLVLAVLVAALDAWLAGRELRAGAWLAGGIALKVVPGALLLVWLVRRSDRAVRACAAGVALACLLPALALGWTENLASLGHWWRAEPLPYLQGGRALLEQHEVLEGQSLTAVVYRALGATPATSSGRVRDAALAHVDPEADAWILRTLQAASLVLLVASLRVSARRDTLRARLDEIALTLVFALALAPLVHKAHLTWLLVPVAVLVKGAPPELSRVAHRVRWAAIAVAFVLIGLTPPALLGRALATRALAFDALFLALVCLAVALLLDVWCTRAERLRALPAGPARAS
jgi:hypothetical protein